MKSFKMKALAVAVVGLAGMGMMGSAFGQSCPTLTSTTGNSTPGGGGAWSSQTVGGGATVSIPTPGLDSTNCAFGINIGASPLSNVKGFVSDTSPQNEPRYRARFYFDISALTLTLSQNSAETFDAFSNTAPGTFGTDEVQVYIVGGSPAKVRFFVADAGQASGTEIITAPLPTSANGHYYVEFDLASGTGSSSTPATPCTGGAAGCFRYWITAEGTSSSDGSPTGTYSANNGGWSGVKQANLGLYGTSATFRTNNHSVTYAVDEFDSRRQTFIGQ